MHNTVTLLINYLLPARVIAQANQNPMAQPGKTIGKFSNIFNEVNKPLIGGSQISQPQNFVSNVINILLPFIFIVAGLGLFVMLLIGGFQIMTAVQDPNRAEEGKQRIVAALIGFFILFAAYWLVQALEIIFGFAILG